ncbi:MAG: hypothetical protein LBF76_00970 [Holosporales bacterium]|jgi:hypothetical protein|nr:hypothetical protein [Holosporales bacterium]
MNPWKLSFVFGLLVVCCGYSQGMRPLPEKVDQLRARHPRVLFLPEEDKLLRQIVKNIGKENWQIVASFMLRRNARQCRERWENYLEFNFNTNPWTPSEDQLLREKVNELGTKWMQIELFFLGRSKNNIKNRWNVLRRRSKETEHFEQNGASAGENVRDPDPLPPSQDHDFWEKLSFEKPIDDCEWFNNF